MYKYYKVALGRYWVVWEWLVCLSVDGRSAKLTVMMKVVGLAGASGCGKSGVSRALSGGEGKARIDLDKVAWGTYRRRSPVYWRLIGRFGEGILDGTGSIDRSSLARIAFSDSAALVDLEAIVHPAVMKELVRVLDVLRRRGTEQVFVEGALLATSRDMNRSLFDAVFWLEASDATRKTRLAASGRLDQLERLRGKPIGQDVVIVDAERSITEVAHDIQRAVDAL